jgi:hypothetical protein
MDINELESFKLSDAVAFHKELNPRLWEDEKLDPEVRDQLLLIAEDFVEYLGISNLKVRDVTLSGSNAAYSYTPHSDLDLHVLVDFNELPNNEVYQELFTAKKTLYNEAHDITVRDVPVELYVQDTSNPVQSLGEYSIVHDKWIRIPKKRRANFDEVATKAKYEKLGDLIELAIKSKDPKRVNDTIALVKRYRKSGLDKAGEFGPENLAYKAVRKQGLVQALHDLKAELHGEKLSIEEDADKQAATLKIQKHLNKKYGANLDLDGKLGPLTLKSINKFMPRAKTGLADEPNKTTAVQGKKLKEAKIDAHRQGDTIWINYFEVPEKGKGLGTQEYMKFEKSLPKDIKKIRLVASDAGYGPTHEFWDRMGFDYAYPDDDNEMVKLLEAPRTLQSQVTPLEKLVQDYGYLTTFGMSHLDKQGATPEAQQQLLALVQRMSKDGKTFANLDKQKMESNRDTILNHIHSTMQYAIPVLKKNLPADKWEAKRGQINAVLTAYNNVSKINESLEPNSLDTFDSEIRKKLNDWMDQDQQYNDPTQRVEFQAKIWPYIQKNMQTIFADKGEKGNGDYPTAPFAAWLLVQHMDAFPQNQIQFYNALKQAIPNHPKIQFLRDRAAVNQWIMKNANNPEYFYKGKPLSSPTVNVRNPAMFKDAGIKATSREEALDNAKQAGNKLLVAAVNATNAQTQPSYTQGINEASGYIPSAKEKNDPRFKTALTVDVRPDAIKKNAKAFGFKTSRAGIPPQARADGKIAEDLMREFKTFLSESAPPKIGYHVTATKNLPIIQKNGINADKRGSSYIWDSREMAEWFMDFQNDEGQDRTILKIDMTGIDARPDPEAEDMSEWSSRFKPGTNGGAWIISGPIPSDKIIG